MNHSHFKIATQGFFAKQRIVNLLSKKSTCDIDLKQKTKLLCIIFCAMQLMMYIGNDLIESVPLDLERISKPGYLGNFKRSLKEKYNELIQQCPEKPEFLIIDPVPAISQVINKQETNPDQ